MPVDYDALNRAQANWPKWHGEKSHWFDSQGGLLARVRSLSASLSDAEIVTKLVEEGQASAEQVWLCLKAAAILAKK